MMRPNPYEVEEVRTPRDDEYPSQWAPITSIAKKAGMAPETLRNWVRRAERDNGGRPGLATNEKAKLKDLEREVKELRRADETLKARRVQKKLGRQR